MKAVSGEDMCRGSRQAHWSWSCTERIFAKAFTICGCRIEELCELLRSAGKKCFLNSLGLDSPLVQNRSECPRLEIPSRKRRKEMGLTQCTNLLHGSRRLETWQMFGRLPLRRQARHATIYQCSISKERGDIREKSPITASRV